MSTTAAGVDAPVSMASRFALSHCGMERPTKSEKPRTKRLRPELRSTFCRFEMPTATIMPASDTEFRNKQHHKNTGLSWKQTEKNVEGGANYGLRNGDEDCTELGENAENDHAEGRVLDDGATADLTSKQNSAN